MILYFPRFAIGGVNLHHALKFSQKRFKCFASSIFIHDPPFTLCASITTSCHAIPIFNHFSHYPSNKFAAFHVPFIPSRPKRFVSQSWLYRLGCLNRWFAPASAATEIKIMMNFE